MCGQAWSAKCLHKVNAKWKRRKPNEVSTQAFHRFFVPLRFRCLWQRLESISCCFNVRVSVWEMQFCFPHVVWLRFTSLYGRWLKCSILASGELIKSSGKWYVDKKLEWHVNGMDALGKHVGILVWLSYTLELKIWSLLWRDMMWWGDGWPESWQSSIW